MFRPVYADGSYGYYPAFSSQVTNSADLLANGGAFKTTATRINTDFVLEQNLDFITKGLNFRGMISWDNQFREQGRGVSDLYNGPQYKWIDPATGAVTKKNPTETTSQFDYLPVQSGRLRQVAFPTVTLSVTSTISSSSTGTASLAFTM